MARSGDGYSRAIAVLKIVLPLVAIGILSTLFLLARPTQVGQPIPFTELEVGEMARSQRLGAPVYRSVTEDGAEVRISANSLQPDTERDGVIHAADISAQVRMKSGYSYDVVAAEGTLADKQGRADLRGGVRLITIDGYVATMPVAEMRTDLTWLESTGPVRIDGPLGSLTAQRMVLRGDPDTGTGGTAVFTGNVRLLYDPRGVLPQ